MLKFKYVEASNFMPFGKKPTRIELDKEEVTLIIGDNKDVGDPGESRNGVGKSSAFQMIVFGLFGKSIDKLRPDEMINLTNGKKMLVTLEFELRGKTYKIVRGRKPNKLEFYEDGETLTRDSMSNTQAMIEHTIGYNYEVFMFIYFLSPYTQSLMAMSGPEQRSIIESVLSLSVLAERADALKLIKDDVLVDAKLIGRDIENAEQVNNRVEQSINRLNQKKDDFDANKGKELDDLVDLKATLEGIDTDQLTEQLNRLTALKEEKAESDRQVLSLKDKKHKLESDLNAKKLELREFESYKEKLETATEKCEEYDKSLKVKKRELKDELNTYPSDKELTTSKTLLDEIDQLSKDIDSYERDIREAERNLKTLKRDISDLDSQLNTLNEGICFTCNQPWHDEDHKAELESKLESLKKEHDELDEILSKALLDHDGVKLDLDNKQADVKYSRQDINRITSEIASLERQIDNFDMTNPYRETLNEFEEDGVTLDDLDEGINEVKSSIELINVDITDIDDEISHLQTTIKSLTDSINEIQGELNNFEVSSQRDIDRIKDEIEKVDNEIKDLKESVNPYIEELKEAEQSFINVDDLLEKRKVIDNDVTHIDYLRKLLTDSKSFIRKRMVDQYIPFVNRKINEYSDTLGSPHTVEINADMTVDIYYMNKKVSYYNLSKGERLRVDLATSMAFKDLMAMLGKNNNLLIVDEMLDSGGDQSLVNRMLKLLVRKRESVFIVSHREELKDLVDSYMIVTKSNGFASISYGKANLT